MTLGWAVIKRPWAVLLYFLARRTWLGSGKDNQWFGISHANFQFSCSVLSDSLQPHESQHARPPCPSPTSGAYSNSYPLMMASVMPSNHLILCRPLLPPSIFPSLRVFSNELVVASGDQHIEVSASASVLPMNIQGWFPLGLTGWISLQSKELSRVFSNTAVQKHQC